MAWLLPEAFRRLLLSGPLDAEGDSKQSEEEAASGRGELFTSDKLEFFVELVE